MVATATQDYNGVMDPSLPGAELIECGLIDLHDGRETVEALLVSMATLRLAKLGIRVPRRYEAPERRLFKLLETSYGDGAHSKYNAYRRRLVSFLRAAR